MQDSKRDTDILNRLLDSVGEGEGGMIWENDIETCKRKKKKTTAPENRYNIVFSSIYGKFLMNY